LTFVVVLVGGGVAMLQSSSPQSTQSTTEQTKPLVASTTERSTQEIQSEKRITIVVIGLVVLETILVTLALVPAQFWTRALPNMTTASLDGPFPAVIAPVITVLLYIVPTVIGLLSRSWQRALLFATLPAWIGLGVFLVAATFKVGAFYVVSVDHVTANVSVLELFAALGALGWLGRYLFKFK